ncbi:Major centromere autoantigen [Trichinella pseudospiralis]
MVLCIQSSEMTFVLVLWEVQTLFKIVCPMINHYEQVINVMDGVGALQLICLHCVYIASCVLVSGPDSRPAGITAVDASVSVSARLLNCCARSRFHDSVALTPLRPIIYLKLRLFAIQVQFQFSQKGSPTHGRAHPSWRSDPRSHRCRLILRTTPRVLPVIGSTVPCGAGCSEFNCSFQNGDKKNGAKLQLLRNFRSFKRLDENPNMKRIGIMRMMKIPSSTLNTILAKRTTLESACNDGNSSTRKQIRSGNFSELEETLPIPTRTAAALEAMDTVRRYVCSFNVDENISISRVISDLKTSAGRYCGDPSTTIFACKLLTVSSSYPRKFCIR